jgi:hypothetical protein
MLSVVSQAAKTKIDAATVPSFHIRHCPLPGNPDACSASVRRKQIALRNLLNTTRRGLRAPHYLADHPLTEDERAHLTEVVHGYTGPCDVVAAREGLAWLRERYRESGEQPPF